MLRGAVEGHDSIVISKNLQLSWIRTTFHVQLENNCQSRPLEILTRRLLLDLFGLVTGSSFFSSTTFTGSIFFSGTFSSTFSGIGFTGDPTFSSSFNGGDFSIWVGASAASDSLCKQSLFLEFSSCVIAVHSDRTSLYPAEQLTDEASVGRVRQSWSVRSFASPFSRTAGASWAVSSSDAEVRRFSLRPTPSMNFTG